MKLDENPVRRLRRALGMNRADFGRAIGKSHQTVGNYESGIRVPPDVVERMKQLAAEHALADIALELSSDDWQSSGPDAIDRSVTISQKLPFTPGTKTNSVHDPNELYSELKSQLAELSKGQARLTAMVEQLIRGIGTSKGSLHRAGGPEKVDLGKKERLVSSAERMLDKDAAKTPARRGQGDRRAK